MLRGWMQLRLLAPFLPPTFLSEKAALFPNNESGRARTLRLMQIVSDNTNLPPSPANALEECFPLAFDDLKGTTHYGWEAYVRHLAKTYPGKCVTIDDVLAWNNLRLLKVDDQGGKPAIDVGVMYVPLRGCSNVDPSATYCHGTPLSSLWSILATGIVRGAYYTELNSYAIWTATDPAECFNYSPYMHIGGGRWVRVMVHFDPEVIRGSEHMRGLGTSRHQIAAKRAFMPFCGISFQFKKFSDLTQIRDKFFMTQFMSVPPNWEADTWCPIMEAHPFEFPAIMLEAPFPNHGSSFGHLRYLGQEGAEPQQAEGASAPEAAAASAQGSSSPAEPAPTKAPNPENLTKEKILRDIPGVIWACGSQDYGLNRDPNLQYGFPSLSDMERSTCKIIPKIAGPDPTGPWNMWMAEFRKMYSFTVNPIFTHAGRDVESRPFSVPHLSFHMKSPEWDMRTCLFAASAISPHLSVRIASAYAHGSSPPLGSAVRNKHVVILHDGYLRFHNNNGKPKNDGYGSIPDDLNRAFSDAFKIGISCEAECVDPADKSSEQVTLADIVKAVRTKIEQAITANRASSTIVVIIWSFQEACKTDQSYSRLVSMMDLTQGHEKISKLLNELDQLSRRVANLVLIGPGNPDLYELPRSGQAAVELSNLYGKAWIASVSRTFLSFPIEYVLESLQTLRSYKLPYSPVNVSRLISRLAMIVRIAMRAAVGQLPDDFGPDQLSALINARTPKCSGNYSGGKRIPPKPPSPPRSRDPSKLDASVGSRVTDMDEPILTEQGDERTNAAREVEADGAVDVEPAQDESMEGSHSVKIRNTQIDLPASTAHFRNVSVRTGAAASIALLHDDVEHGDGLPHAQRPEFRSDYAPGEVTYGSTTYGPVAVEHQQTPTAETGPDRIPYQSPDASEAEVKMIRISKLIRLMKEHDDRVEEHSKALEALMNPPTTAPVVDHATPMFFPDGNLAYDEEKGIRKC